MPTEVFAQPPTHHLRVVLVIDLTLALLIPILRRNHIDLHPHGLHLPRRLIPKTARFVAHHYSLSQAPLLLQPPKKSLGTKLLRGLRSAPLDLAHHPVALRVHVDRDLD
jgi:hypothetical protein